MKKFLVISFIFCSLNLWAQNIVTTTSWVKAYVTAAGGEDVYNFAPADMSHPPEYVLKPSDILKLNNAKYVVFAGYEGMVKELKGSLGIDESRMIKIGTGYSFKIISDSILTVAKSLGTEKKAKISLEEISTLYKTSISELKKDGLLDKKVIVHFHQQTIAKELGLNIVGIYGPGPIKPSELKDFKELGADYIIDNIHSPIGKSLIEILPNSIYLSFVNFPGTNGTKSLIDVINYNVGQFYEK